MKESEKKQLALRIKSLRESKGYTQEEFAEICGTSTRTISNIERGQSVPDLSTIFTLAKHLSVSLDELLKIAPHSKKTAARQQKEYEIINRIQSANDGMLDYISENIELIFKHFN